jgi:beta-galactosidase/beta-glucuronidase
MKQYLIPTLLIFCICSTLHAQDAQWSVVEGKILTEWASEVDPENPLPEYPRPQMVREDWYNLNGLWDYAIQSKGSGTPTSFEGKILVPFAVGSALSGVGKRVGEENELWYHTTFELPRNMRRKKVLLHFGTVDWETEVFVNGESVGTHQAGYDPFSFDISEALNNRGAQELVLRVWDPPNDGPQPRGKQVKDPEGIWYTPMTGIWQTVWMKAVPDSYISSTKNTPDLDNNAFKVSANVANAQNGDHLGVRVLDGENTVAEQSVGASEEAVLTIDNPTLWEPGNHISTIWK